MSKVYLDSCIIIYLIEKHPAFSSTIESALIKLNANALIYSPLSRMECMVMPLRTGDTPLKDLYEAFFSAQTEVTIPSEVFQNAAQLRADFPALKTPDALHLASAIYYNCDEFWTNDNRLTGIAPTIVKNILTP